MITQYTDTPAELRTLAGKINGLTGNGLFAFWKVNIQAKDGQRSHRIVKIGLDEDGSRVPWLEGIEDELLNLMAPTTKTAGSWKAAAATAKKRLPELIHRELIYSGSITEEVSYSATPLAIIGVEK